jgi:hypothetical protein
MLKPLLLCASKYGATFSCDSTFISHTQMERVYLRLDRTPAQAAFVFRRSYARYIIP